MRGVSEVTYTSDAGPILPKRQWHEAITVRREGVTLTRNGRVAETEVNAGRWAVAVDVRRGGRLIQAA